MAANAFDWLMKEQLAGCANPSVSALAAAGLKAGRIGLLINLHERPDPPELLDELQADTLHLPVRDFEPPSQDQLQRGVDAIGEALKRGTRVAVHCYAGLGRTGTLLAAYLVSTGAEVEDAIARVRALRPGSIETLQQEQAVHQFAQQRATFTPPERPEPR